MKRFLALVLAAWVALGPCAPAFALTPGQRIVILTNGCDAAGQTLVAAMTSRPAGQRKRLICSTVKALETASAYQNCDAIQVYAAATPQAAMQNWIKPGTFTATASGGPTFTADRGYAGDGFTSFLDTNFNPTTATAPHFTQNSAFLGGWSLTQASSGSTAPFGWAVTGTGGIYVIPRNSTNEQGIDNNNTTTFGTSANSDGRGWFTVNRSGSAGFDLGAQGLFLNTTVAVSAAPINHTIRVDNFASGSFSSVQVAGVAICGSLTAPQQLAIYNALHSYFQAVGASQ